MKFLRENCSSGVTIPKVALKLSGLSDSEKLELHTQDCAVVLLKQEMTAMEMLAVVGSLNRLSGDLLSYLAGACEKCVGCEDDCRLNLNDRDIRIPEYLLDAAEISRDAKLYAQPDPDGGRIIVRGQETDHDLSDVPKELLDALIEYGVCLEYLNELLGSGEVVYGAY